ncbi:PPIC-type PPIASE domain-containing protein [Sphingomonas carotinifaciens]|nr:PPIC-type PPIASE domain-containing protein [Sphingomonas carotinifaciens]
MLRSRADLAWLLPPALVTPPPHDPIVEAEARSVIGLADVARARHLDRKPDMRAALRLLELAVLAEAARRDLAAGITVSDDDVRARLAAKPGRYDEFLLSHIFVAVGEGRGGITRTEEEAKRKVLELRRRIATGEDFANVARTESDDAATAEAAGELSSMFGRYMADEFFPFARMLKQDEVSQPIRGKLGYHLIRLEQRIPATAETARFLITQDIREERMPDRIAAAIREAKP